MNLLVGIEASAGLSGPCKCEIGLGGESLTNVVFEKASKIEERRGELLTMLHS